MKAYEFIIPILVVIIYAGLILLVECQEVARADVRLLDSKQWTPETHLWTARAAVAEVGWHDGKGWSQEKKDAKELEQIAVWYVLRSRWLQLSERWPKLRFLDVLKAYCALGTRGQLSKRQRWIRQLTLDGRQPAGWPPSASWEKHQPLWIETLDRAEIWAKSRAESNPCPGANHFGGLRAGDVPRGRMMRHPCSDRFEAFDGSTFYTVERR